MKIQNSAMVIILFFPSAKLAHRVGWEKETTPTYPNMSPLYRGEFTTCSLWKAAHMAGWKKKPPRHIRVCQPSIEGNLPLIPLSEGCPYGGLGRRNHPDISEYATPLSRGIYLLFPSAEGCPKGGVGVRNSPRYVLDY